MGNTPPTNKTGRKVVSQVRRKTKENGTSLYLFDYELLLMFLLCAPLCLQKLENAKKTGVLSLSEHKLEVCPDQVFQ
jgi:hypothetical protein